MKVEKEKILSIIKDILYRGIFFLGGRNTILLEIAAFVYASVFFLALLFSPFFTREVAVTNEGRSIGPAEIRSSSVVAEVELARDSRICRDRGLKVKRPEERAGNTMSSVPAGLLADSL